MGKAWAWLWALPLMVGGISGCALVTVPADPASPYYMVPEGSVIELHQPLRIPPGSTRVWLVRGQPAAGRDWYAPGCNLEIDTLDRERVQIVDPGVFEVSRVQRTSEHTSERAAGVVVAALGAGFSWDSGDNRTWQGYHLWLHSDRQPDVRRLTCKGIYAEPWQATPPSIEVIRETLGAVASLRLPGV